MILINLKHARRDFQTILWQTFTFPRIYFGLMGFDHDLGYTEKIERVPDNNDNIACNFVLRSSVFG